MVLEQLRRDWFKPSEASAKRASIQQLIISLAEGRSATSWKDAEEASECEANGESAGVSESIESHKCDLEKLRGFNIQKRNEFLLSLNLQPLTH